MFKRPLQPTVAPPFSGIPLGPGEVTIRHTPTRGCISGWLALDCKVWCEWMPGEGQRRRRFSHVRDCWNLGGSLQVTRDEAAAAKGTKRSPNQGEIQEPCDDSTNDCWSLWESPA